MGRTHKSVADCIGMEPWAFCAKPDGCGEEVSYDAPFGHSPKLQDISCWQATQFTDGYQTPPASPRAVFNRRVYDSPISAASSEQHSEMQIAPPPAPNKSWNRTEVAKDVEAAVFCGCMFELSWALRPYSCSCSIDHQVHAAISTQNPEALEMLLSCGASRHMLNVTCGGQTPWHKAILTAQEDGDIGCTMCNLLLAHGVSVDAKDAEGEAPIHGACRTSNLPIVKLLFQHGADANLVTSSGFTALHLLCQRPPPHVPEDLLVLREMLAYGAAPAHCDAYGQRPYDYINKPVELHRCRDPIKMVMSDVLASAEQQKIRNERWHARRSSLFLHARPESGHVVCQMSAELLRMVVRFL